MRSQITGGGTCSQQPPLASPSLPFRRFGTLIAALPARLSLAPLSAPQTTIRVGSAQILSLVEDALAVGFDGTGQFTVTPVLCNPRTEVLQRSWSVVRLQKRYAEKTAKIRMRYDIAPNVPELTMIDAARACQVLTNLLGNAVKFVPEGTGEVTMRCTYCEDSEMLTMDVKDNGRGLSPEGMARLFRPFVQAEGEGAPRAEPLPKLLPCDCDSGTCLRVCAHSVVSFLPHCPLPPPSRACVRQTRRGSSEGPASGSSSAATSRRVRPRACFRVVSRLEISPPAGKEAPSKTRC